MDMMAHEKEDVMEAEQICKELKKLIAREKEEGTNEEAEIEKLQQAYDLCEDFIGMEKDEVKPSKSPAPKVNAATMPINKLRDKISQTPKMPPTVSNPPNLNAY